MGNLNYLQKKFKNINYLNREKMSLGDILNEA